MKKFSLFQKEEEKKPQNKIAFQGGSYSLAISCIVLAILIAVNVLVNALPSSLTKYDISSTQLYSITSNTKVVVNNLEDDVTIYWVVQADQEDDVIENLLERYESLSDYITVVKKNPDAFPTFTEQYTDEDVPNNSLIVECGDKNRYISYNDIYVTESSMYSYTYSTSFDGEGEITSAIDYVTSDNQPILYCLEGHGESELPETLADQIEKSNIETESLSLVSEDGVPEDAAAVMIYSPTSDLSEEEADLLSSYVSDGGKLMVVSGPVEDGTLTNLNSLLEEYDVSVNEGIVIEGNTDSYAFSYPYILLPTIESNTITDSLTEENYYVIFPLAEGLTLNGSDDNVSALLTTSSDAYAKADGYNLTTYEKEDGDTDGPFTLAVSISDDSGGNIIWFGSSYFLEDMYNAYSSGANVDLAMNAISSLVGESESMAIRSKSLNYNYLTISDSTSSLLKVLMIGVFPLAYLGVGIVVVTGRRKKQNESH